MRVLLLGATGNLGSRLLPALLAHNHTVTVLIRNPSKLRAQIPSSVFDKVSIAHGDATDSTVIKDALISNNCDAIVSSAGVAAVFPWQELGMQPIVHAVAAAAVEASQILGRPMRCWFLGGPTALNIPGSDGRLKIKD